MTSPSRGKLVLLGILSAKPWPGVVWQTLHYLLGFHRLGFDVYYLEAHGCYPHMFVEHEGDDGALKVARFIDSLMRQYDLGDSWAYQSLHSDGALYGLSPLQLERILADAALIINLHGATLPRPEHYRSGRLVYVETDPVEAQIELAEGLESTEEFLSLHSAFFTFAENYGTPYCPLPAFEKFHFRPTRQPVLLDLWVPCEETRPVFTTVGNWKQLQREISFEGDVYHWSKHFEFLKFLDLPLLSGRQFELALSASSLDGNDHALLKQHGWVVVDSLRFSADLDAYRDYIRSSFAEFTVAKDQNVRLATGWFSDRSAAYLACGRPVITQETGFSRVLPAGRGLYGFSTIDEALAAVDAVWSDPEGQRRAAQEVARECFSHEVVLGRMLEDLGL